MLKHRDGYFYIDTGDVRIILMLSPQTLPKDHSLDKLRSIAAEYDMAERLVALPDLHFKVKNFVPSGMVIPLRNVLSPQLLGPNNDGIGAVKVRIKNKKIDSADIAKVFSELKERIVLFRRKQAVVSEEEFAEIMVSGITVIGKKWGFTENELQAFEDGGCAYRFGNYQEATASFPEERPETLPDFVPEHLPAAVGPKCLGVLDGTSHFIELYETQKFINPDFADLLDVTENDLFFMVHAGAGDIGLTVHRAYLNRNNNKYDINDERERRALDGFRAAANFGFGNRLLIYKIIKETVRKYWGSNIETEVFSDSPHDYVKVTDEGLVIHRKGAAGLYPASYYKAGNPWSMTGMPYLFPSSAGGDAYIISNAEGNPLTFYTVSHGAGRLLRKEEAIEKYKDLNVRDFMKHKIMLFRYDFDVIEGQNPLAFKDIDEVLKLFALFKLASPIVKLRPLASLKA